MSEIELGTLYDFNKRIIGSQPPQTPEEIESAYSNVIDWISYIESKDIILMCRERYDFTIFHRVTSNLDKLLTELQETVDYKGVLKRIDYIHAQDNFEFWIDIPDEETGEKETFMFLLFRGEGFVIEV